MLARLPNLFQDCSNLNPLQARADYLDQTYGAQRLQKISLHMRSMAKAMSAALVMFSWNSWSSAVAAILVKVKPTRV